MEIVNLTIPNAMDDFISAILRKEDSMSILFQPVKIGNMTVKNRFVRSATAERAVDERGFVTDEMFDVYRQLAEGGVGLLITGHAYVHEGGRASLTQAAIHKDEYIPRLTELVDATHSVAEECKIVIQITHGGRQVSTDSVIDPIAPSAVTDNDTGITPREMTEAEIEVCIDAFAQAARRAKEAGFDGVQLHSAHGFLISEFNSPYTNRRTDKWGGSLENRMRFLLEVYRRVRGAVGREYPIMVKLNTADYVEEGGLAIEESVQIAKTLSDAGIDAIETSGGMYESIEGQGAARKVQSIDEEAYFAPNATKIKQVVNVPVILVGGLLSTSVMEEVIQEGVADFVSLSRPLIREPDLPNKIKSGKEKADCISCNGCFSPRLRPVRCVHTMG